jgi:hypothetical protein
LQIKWDYRKKKKFYCIVPQVPYQATLVNTEQNRQTSERKSKQKNSNARNNNKKRHKGKQHRNRTQVKNTHITVPKNNINNKK